MKEKEITARIEWMVFLAAFILLVIVGKVPLPGVYTGVIIDSMAITFGFVSLGYGIRYMVIRNKYIKELFKDD